MCNIVPNITQYITPLPPPKVADVRGLAFICMHAEAPCLSPCRS